jgi:multimeric flavodoxin WrbA
MDEIMRPEYDFSKAKRGKHYRPLHNGYSVQVEQADGTSSLNHFALGAGMVFLEPDVRAMFPDSDSVNAALRSLIYLMEHLPKHNQTSPRQVAEK